MCEEQPSNLNVLDTQGTCRAAGSGVWALDLDFNQLLGDARPGRRQAVDQGAGRKQSSAP